MTKDEAVKDIRAIRRTCKGTWVAAIDDKIKKQVVATVNRVNYDNKTKVYKEGTSELTEDKVTGTPQSFITSLLTEGQPEAAAALERVLRKRCGADFNDIIAAGPLDGSEQTYKCPKCGLTGRYRAPLYEIAV